MHHYRGSIIKDGIEFLCWSHNPAMIVMVKCFSRWKGLSLPRFHMQKTSRSFTNHRTSLFPVSFAERASLQGTAFSSTLASRRSISLASIRRAGKLASESLTLRSSWVGIKKVTSDIHKQCDTVIQCDTVEMIIHIGTNCDRIYHFS